MQRPVRNPRFEWLRTLGQVQRLHLALQPLDLDLGQLDAECVAFIYERDERNSFRLKARALFDLSVHLSSCLENPVGLFNPLVYRPNRTHPDHLRSVAQKRTPSHNPRRNWRNDMESCSLLHHWKLCSAIRIPGRAPRLQSAVSGES